MIEKLLQNSITRPNMILFFIHVENNTFLYINWFLYTFRIGNINEYVKLKLQPFSYPHKNPNRDKKKILPLTVDTFIYHPYNTNKCSRHKFSLNVFEHSNPLGVLKTTFFLYTHRFTHTHYFPFFFFGWVWFEVCLFCSDIQDWVVVYYMVKKCNKSW